MSQGPTPGPTPGRKARALWLFLILPCLANFCLRNEGRLGKKEVWKEGRFGTKEDLERREFWKIGKSWKIGKTWKEGRELSVLVFYTFFCVNYPLKTKLSPKFVSIKVY